MTRTSTPARPSRASTVIPNPPSGTKGATTALTPPTATPLKEVTNRKAGPGARGKNPSTAAANGKKPATKKPPPPPLSKVATRQHSPNVPLDETPPPVPDSPLRMHQSPERSTSPTLNDTVAAADGTKEDPAEHIRRLEAMLGESRGLSITGLREETDANVIAARNVLYRWVMFITQRVLWDGHWSQEHRIAYGALWSSLSTTQQGYLTACYRQRVLDAPDLRPIFFFSQGVDLSKPAGPNVIPQDKVRAAASVFEADWPMEKMVKALKNEKDGVKELTDWTKEFHPLSQAVPEGGRPIIGNPVTRICRLNRLPHSLETVHSSAYKVAPASINDQAPSKNGRTRRRVEENRNGNGDDLLDNTTGQF